MSSPGPFDADPPPGGEAPPTPPAASAALVGAEAPSGPPPPVIDGPFGESPAMPTAPRRRIDWSAVPAPVITLAVVGFSLALAVQMAVMRAETRSAFILSNTLGKAPRGRLLLSLAASIGVALLVAVPLLFKRPRDARRLENGAAVLGPLALSCLLVPLTNLRLAENPLLYLLLLTAFVAMVEPLLGRSIIALGWWREQLVTPRAVPRVRFWSRPWFPFTVVVLAGLAYGSIVGYFTILNHHRLGTAAFDLGIYDNLMYTAMHGHPFRSPVLFGPAGGNYLAGHAEFVLLLFVPIYALHPSAQTMLLLQSFLLGLAAVPLYLFAKTLLSRGAAALLAVAYLFFAPLHGPNFYDFHWLPIAVFFHFWLYYAIARRKNWLVVAMLLVLFSVREDVAVGTAVLGLFLVLTRLRPRMGLFIAAASITWFGIDRFVIMPLAGQWWFQNIYNDLFADGESTYGSVIKTILTNPVYLLSTLVKEAKLTYLLHMLAPLAFVPVRRLATALFIVPGFFFTLMTSNYPPVLSISFQYTTHWIPYLFLAVVLGLYLIERDYGRPRAQAALATLVVGLVCHSYCYGALLQHQHFVGGFSTIAFKMTDAEKQRYRDLEDLVKLIPRDASVAATESEVPHVSNRSVIYTLRQSPGPVDYLFIGRTHLDGAHGSLNAAFASTSYGLVARKGDDLFLFKKGPSTAGTEAAKALLGVPAAAH